MRVGVVARVKLLWCSVRLLWRSSEDDCMAVGFIKTPMEVGV